ncbi:hypothetical protein DB345_17790 [Spartobacteria bacterium LR76]|nr:hypothetical protein DB345_17790 [Spartobacteria bacterium LR76]
MAIKETTIKRLFAKCKNQCAIPECHATLVVGEMIIAEICHIRARRKGGPRYDPALTAEQRDQSANLILLCPTCHKLVDKDKTGAFSVEYLLQTKADHEKGGAFELSPLEERQALAILSDYRAKRKKVVTSSIDSGISSASAGRNGIAISFVGNNVGGIKIHAPRSSKSTGLGYPSNSIGADANFSGYTDYLCDLYVQYMLLTGEDEQKLRAKIGTSIKREFRLSKRTRYHIPAEKFPSLVAFLHRKLSGTPVGRKHVRKGTKLCSSFEEWRTTKRGEKR